MISDAAKRVRKPIRFSSGDISGGGAFLRSDLLFEVGEMLVMEFDLPGGRHIRTQGRVVRVARGGAKDRFPGMGLEFIDLSPDDRAAIARARPDRDAVTMAETLEELTYDYEDEGVLVRKQIDRAVLTKGSWATVMFLFQELDRAKGKFRPPKMAIVRFKKSKGSYRKQSSFNISNEKQARQITEVLEGWYPKIAEMTAEATAERTSGDGDGDEDADADERAPGADDSSPTMIAVIVNPRSRANRRNPRIAAEFQAIVGDRGRVLAPKTSRSWTRWRPTCGTSPPDRHRRSRRRRHPAQDGDRAGARVRRRPAAADRHPVRRDHERRGDLAAHPRARRRCS